MRFSVRTLLSVTTIAAIFSAVVYHYWFKPSEEELRLRRIEASFHRLNNEFPKTLGEWQAVDSGIKGVYRFQEHPVVVFSSEFQQIGQRKNIEIFLYGGNHRGISSVSGPSYSSGYTHLHDQEISFDQANRNFVCSVSIIDREMQRVACLASGTKDGQWRGVPLSDFQDSPFAYKIELVYKTPENMVDEELGEHAVAVVSQFLVDFLPQLDPLFQNKQ